MTFGKFNFFIKHFYILTVLKKTFYCDTPLKCFQDLFDDNVFSNFNFVVNERILIMTLGYVMTIVCHKMTEMERI